MIPNKIACALIAALPLAVIAVPAVADVKDYEFRLTQSEFKQGNGVVVSVRLVDRRTGKSVPDALIITKRIDMEPDGMAGMTSPIEAVPTMEPGTYGFRTNLSMAGRWRLSLTAKIQSEAGALDNKLVLKAAP